MPSKTRETSERRQRREALKRQAARLTAAIASGALKDHPVCAYPTCEEPRVTDDCCYAHAVDGSPANGSNVFLPNDGIIDWQAIEMARSGARVVRLSWVEFEIAGAYILLDGETQDEMRARTGVQCYKANRIKRMQEVADALGAAA
jgi:hypothetical protein